MVLTGLPKTLNAEILLGLLDEHFTCSYDYFYLPMDMDRFESTGLAYINFREHDKAVACRKFFSGFRSWPGRHASDRTCRAEWSSIQGQEANIEKQQRLNWADIDIPEDCKPMVFDENGVRLPTMDVFVRNDESAYAYSSDRARYVSGRWEEEERRSAGWTKEWYGGGTKGSRGRPHWEENWRAGKQQDWWPNHRQHQDAWDSRARRTWQNYDSWEYEERPARFDWQEKNLNEHSSLETAEGVNTTSLLENLMEDPSYQEVEAGNSTEAHVVVPESTHRPSDGQASVPKANEKPLSALAMIRYACPRCRKRFPKWSACHSHILNESQCRKEWGQTDSLALQARCQEMAKDLDQEETHDLAIVNSLRLQ